MAQPKCVEAANRAARNFKKLVLKSGLTQIEFSEKFGVDVRTVRNWYKRLDSLTTIEKIAKFFNVNYKDVLFGDE